MYDCELLAQKTSEGGVCVLPTDTVYGLACSALSPEAVKMMYKIKQRDSKPGTIIASSLEQLRALGFDSSELERAQDFWPGPVSVILSAGNELEYLHMGLYSLAVRIPADNDLQELLAHTGPLATTSANYPSMPTVTTIEQARNLFGKEIALYVDGGDLSGRAASQIIRLLDDGSYERIR